MKLDLKFKENAQRLDLWFGQYQDLTDGGYERGYAEGHEQGLKDAPNYLQMLLEDTLTEYHNDTLSSVPNYAFYIKQALKKLSFPNARRIGMYSIYNCKNLEQVDCHSATALDTCSFQSCTAIKRMEFDSLMSIGPQALRGCSSLKTLILRGDTICSLSNVNALQGTPIESGTGFVYVRANLVDGYKAGTNWSTYADQFRALEDYPEICG